MNDFNTEQGKVRVRFRGFLQVPKTFTVSALAHLLSDESRKVFFLLSPLLTLSTIEEKDKF